jgi:hypothetical protein
MRLSKFAANPKKELGTTTLHELKIVEQNHRL